MLMIQTTAKLTPDDPIRHSRSSLATPLIDEGVANRQQPSRTGKRRKVSGFTLLEVLIAMTMLAIALPALLKAVGSHIRNAADLKERTIAQWVALNRVAELQATQTWPSVGKSNGTDNMADYEWYWEIKVTQTSEENMRRVDVEVRRDREDKYAISAVEAYLGKP